MEKKAPKIRKLNSDNKPQPVSESNHYCFQAKEEKQADDEEIKRLGAEVQRLKNALKEAQNRAKQV